MQKISFGNKEYVKASAVAKRFRYTQDYVGQLCRSKKVDARLVGRVWYVEPDSVAAYRKTKHSTQKTAKAHNVPANQTTKRNPNPKPVGAVLRSKTLKSTQQVPVMRVAGTKVQYSSDNEVSIPILDTLKDRHTLVVTSSTRKEDGAKAEESIPAQKPVQKIKIKKIGSTKTNFKTEKLPEISLSGKLDVKDTSDEIERKNQQKQHNDQKKPLKLKPNKQISPESHQGQVSNKESAPARIVESGSKSKTSSTVATANFAQKRTKTTNAVSNSKPLFVHADWFLVSSLVLGVCSALVILSLASLGEVTPSTNNSWSLFFNVDQLLNLLP